jgi:predicted ester cyclase
VSDYTAVTRRFWELIWNRRDLSKLPQLLTEDYTVHIGGGTFGGRDAMRAVGEQWFEPFPDLRCSVLHQVGDGDFVADHLLFTGTHTGGPYHPGLFRARGLPPIPTSGREFEFTQTCLTRLMNGLMAETWEDFDRVRLWMQLGVELVVPG